MPFRINHETRPFGDRFIRCQAEGMLVSFSNARTGETLAPAGSDGARWGLEHFAIECEDVEADIVRLTKLGARHQEGPLKAPNGTLFAFMSVPGDVRIELLQLPK